MNLIHSLVLYLIFENIRIPENVAGAVDVAEFRNECLTSMWKATLPDRNKDFIDSSAGGPDTITRSLIN